MTKKKTQKSSAKGVNKPAEDDNFDFEIQLDLSLDSDQAIAHNDVIEKSLPTSVQVSQAPSKNSQPSEEVPEKENLSSSDLTASQVANTQTPNQPEEPVPTKKGGKKTLPSGESQKIDSVDVLEVSRNTRRAKPEGKEGSQEPPSLSFDEYFEFKEGELAEWEIARAQGSENSNAAHSLSELELSEDISLESAVEAIIFASDKPIRLTEILDILHESGEPDDLAAEMDALPWQGVSRKDVEGIVESLRREYRERAGGVQLELVDGDGYQFLTVVSASRVMQKMFSKKPRPLSRAALETLAIVAYRQPVTRADIEYVRGVDAGSIIKNLLDRELVYCCGRKEDSGRPMLFATTSEFLKVFRLRSLDDLPPLAAFQPPVERMNEGLDLADKGDQPVDVEGFIADPSQEKPLVSSGLEESSEESEESGQFVDFELELGAPSGIHERVSSHTADQPNQSSIQGAQYDPELGDVDNNISGENSDADSKVSVPDGGRLSSTGRTMDQGKSD